MGTVARDYNLSEEVFAPAVKRMRHRELRGEGERAVQEGPQPGLDLVRWHAVNHPALAQGAGQDPHEPRLQGLLVAGRGGEKGLGVQLRQRRQTQPEDQRVDALRARAVETPGE